MDRRTKSLPLPELKIDHPQGALCLVDDLLFRETGVKVAFTSRIGGVSIAPYDSLNLGSHVGDDPSAVAQNRAHIMDALGSPSIPILTANQVHGDELVVVSADDGHSLALAQEVADEGADGFIVAASNVAAMLCYADCVPVILVAPCGSFAVVHSGWRGAMMRIAAKAARKLADIAECKTYDINAYIGPYINSECFETSEEIANGFATEFSSNVLLDARHVDLGAAVTFALLDAGLDRTRIADSDICTVCESDTFFSYRASGGISGRHGAIAFKLG